MGDLEDSFLRKNVPGRYTSWTEENDDERGADANDLDSEDDEYYLEGLPPLLSSNSESDRRIEPPSASTSNVLKKSCNTGVKGVLADYREVQRREMEEAKLTRLEEVTRRQNRHRHDIYNKDKISINCSGDGNSDDDNSISIRTDDDEYGGENSKPLAKHPLESTLQPIFRKSQYPKLTPDEYVQLLDEMENNVHKGVLYVIVHLYESSVPECRHLHSVLKLMTSGSVTSSSRFIEVDALEANPDMDTVILPTILIYNKRGELKHNLVRFTDDLPHGYTAWDLSDYFDNLGIVV